MLCVIKVIEHFVFVLSFKSTFHIHRPELSILLLYIMHLANTQLYI